MFKGSNNVALGYDEGSILIKVCQMCSLYLIPLISTVIYLYLNIYGSNSHFVHIGLTEHASYPIAWTGRASHVHGFQW